MISVVVFEPWLYYNVFGSGELHPKKYRDFEVVANRGDSGNAPENTLAAVQSALELGVDRIEIDVRNTREGEIVAFHDDTLSRTTSGKGYVHDVSLVEIQSLDAGSWFDPAFSDETVPTLAEVMDAIRGKCILVIDIKHMDHPHYERFSEKVIDIIREKDGFEWCILQAHENIYLRKAHEYDSRIVTKKLLIGEDSSPLLAYFTESRLFLGRSRKRDNSTALNPHVDQISPRRVFHMKARGYKIFTYPVDDKETAIKVLNMGVNGIITNHPAAMMALKREIVKKSKAMKNG